MSERSAHHAAVTRLNKGAKVCSSMRRRMTQRGTGLEAHEAQQEEEEEEESGAAHRGQRETEPALKRQRGSHWTAAHSQCCNSFQSARQRRAVSCKQSRSQSGGVR